MIPWIDPAAPPNAFPRTDQALVEPNGLLAAGGDLRPERLVEAYRRGIFPWYTTGDPILWWCPDPRAVLVPNRFHASRRLRRSVRKSRPLIRLDGDFVRVVEACAADRPGQSGTWITPAMIRAYRRLFDLNVAHCVEAHVAGEVVGGLYGLAIGRVFFGESMYSRRSEGSKLALYGLCRWLDAHGFCLLDCQIESAHLYSLGAEAWSRERFVASIRDWCEESPKGADWQTEFTLVG